MKVISGYDGEDEDMSLNCEFYPLDNIVSFVYFGLVTWEEGKEYATYRQDMIEEMTKKRELEQLRILQAKYGGDLGT